MEYQERSRQHSVITYTVKNAKINDRYIDIMNQILYT